MMHAEFLGDGGPAVLMGGGAANFGEGPSPYRITLNALPNPIDQGSEHVCLSGLFDSSPQSK